MSSSMRSALAVLALLGSALAVSAQPPTRPAAPAAQSAQASTTTIAPIPIPEVAQRAEQVTTLLRSGQAPEGPESDDADLELTNAAERIRKQHVSTTEALTSGPRRMRWQTWRTPGTPCAPGWSRSMTSSPGVRRSRSNALTKAVSDPAPLALCTGFGDSALKFELRVWTRVDDAESFLSQLAIAVHAALATAKIEIPFPQCDVHIRNGEGGHAGVLTNVGAG